ncbi:MAG: hypothetical protein PVH05_14640, partial [Burkholderiales bacterium]
MNTQLHTDDSRPDILNNPIVRRLVMDTLDDARALMQRFREVDSFNVYVHERMAGILLANVIMFLISIGCVMGIVTQLPDTHWVFVLPLILVLPVVLAGSMCTQMYIFFAWIEGRSMEQALGSRRKAPRGALATWLRKRLRVDVGPFPRVPWLLATLFVVVPLTMLAYTWLPAAAGFTALAIVM